MCKSAWGGGVVSGPEKSCAAPGREDEKRGGEMSERERQGGRRIEAERPTETGREREREVEQLALSAVGRYVAAAELLSVWDYKREKRRLG